MNAKNNRCSRRTVGPGKLHWKIFMRNSGGLRRLEVIGGDFSRRCKGFRAVLQKCERIGIDEFVKQKLSLTERTGEIGKPK